MKFAIEILGVLAFVLISTSVGHALDTSKESMPQVSSAAAFAPANIQLPPEKISPVISVLPEILEIDPLADLQGMSPKKQARKAFRRARAAFRQGNLEKAIICLKYSAQSGYLLAQWELGKAYRDGLGVLQNNVKAFDLFRQVADSHDPNQYSSRRKLKATVSALVALADYSRVGLAGTAFATKNLQRAHSLYHYAATQYGHPGAQYALGMMYLNGEGLEKNRRVGMRWLMLASRKSFAKAQARLGDIYLSYTNSPKHRLKGLMWHRLAEKNAQQQHQEKLLARSSEIFAKASDSERQLAAGMMVKMQESYDISPTN